VWKIRWLRMSLKLLPDLVLLERCCQDDRTAFEVLFERYFRRLFIFTLHYIKDRATAEELVMDLMLSLWKKRHDLELRGELLPYLFRAMRNAVISHARKRAIATVSLEPGDDYSLLARNADYNLYASEVDAIYREKLDQLSPQRRRVFELSRFENKSYAEIAVQLDLSVNTVRNHMNAALQYFREHLGKYVDVGLVLWVILWE
jgi:RNA polymerase sigma-70 factor (family 1)